MRFFYRFMFLVIIFFFACGLRPFSEYSETKTRSHGRGIFVCSSASKQTIFFILSWHRACSVFILYLLVFYIKLEKKLAWHNILIIVCIVFVYCRWNVSGTLETTLSILFLLTATLMVVISFQIVLRANLHVSFFESHQRNAHQRNKRNKNRKITLLGILPIELLILCKHF